MVIRSINVQPSVWSAVFRRICQQLATDREFHRVVGDNFRTWSGVPADKMPFAPSMNQPIVRLTPIPSNVDWYTADAQAGTLNVHVEIGVQSLCIDDPLDLWDIIVEALRPQNRGLNNALVAIGAETGEIVFSDPAVDPKPDASPEGFFFATGRFHLRVIRQIH